MTALPSLTPGPTDGEAAEVLDLLERILSDGDSRRVFRTHRQRPEAARGNIVWQRMRDSALAQASYPNAFGGSEFALSANVLMAEVIGSHLGPDAFTACSVFPAALLAGMDAACITQAASMLNGAVLAVAIQDPAAGDASPTHIVREGDAAVLRGVKRRVRGAPYATAFVVIAQDAAGPTACIVPAEAPGVGVAFTPLVDGTSAATVTFEDVALHPHSILAEAETCAESITRAIEWMNVAISAELLGIQTTLLAMTLEHIKTRRQFDQRLSDFQVLRHRAVDMFTWREMTRVVVQEAAATLASPSSTPHQRALLASRAKARAADAAEKIGREAIQMHGAIGFSDEYDVGLFVKRARVLAPWFGGVDHHRQRFAELSPAEMREAR